jgi:SAM-dependent methyltransferase
MAREFDELVAESLSHPVVGWDFSWLGKRLQDEQLPWDYPGMVTALGLGSPDLLDLGTGGGEWLASLALRPDRTVATEGWAPNVAIARKRLAPLGVEVVAYEGPGDNVSQREDEPPLPFPDGSFHLVSNRHESFVARELARVLVPGGRFVTQQVGGWAELGQLLGVPTPSPVPRNWSLAMAADQLESAGLEVVDSGEARPVTRCTDIGALVWYLTAVPWALPDFQVDRYRDRLLELHRRSAAAPIEFGEDRFWLLAQKPGPSAPGTAPS